MADTTALVIPGSEFDAQEHGYDMTTVLRAAEMFGVRIPRWVGPRCLAKHRTGWTCTRSADHELRHHATFPSAGGSDIVLAVWHQGDY